MDKETLKVGDKVRFTAPSYYLNKLERRWKKAKIEFLVIDIKNGKIYVRLTPIVTGIYHPKFFDSSF